MKSAMNDLRLNKTGCVDQKTALQMAKLVCSVSASIISRKGLDHCV
jgi:hypothetical protein